jgi:F-type H+-transporting ATPase subunit a
MEHHGPKSWLLKLPGLPEIMRDEKYLHVNGALTVFLIITVFSVLAYLAIRGREKDFLVPKPKFGLVSVVDVMIESLYKFVVGIIGPHGEEHFPFVASCFIFVLVSNFLGLLPMSASPSANPNTTLALGLLSFLYYNIMGVKAHGVVGYAKHFLMGLGFAGIPIALLELVSHFVRPISLGLRLFINLEVDHMVLGAFTEIFAWLLPVPLLLFGLVICTIQAFIFATLTAVYIQMATEHE